MSGQRFTAHADLRATLDDGSVLTCTNVAGSDGSLDLIAALARNAVDVLEISERLPDGHELVLTIRKPRMIGPHDFLSGGMLFAAKFYAQAQYDDPSGE